jgi:SAM-dependent methyltransferase
MSLYRKDLWEPYHLAKAGRDTEHYWDTRAVGFSHHSGVSNYVEEFVELCHPRAGWTALDVGCGTGALTLRLAQTLDSITGFDVSGGMLSILEDDARVQDLSNVSAIKGSWEDDWDVCGVPVVDLVVESRALLTADLPKALAKLDSHARRRVCLTTVCGDLAYNDRRVIEAVGRTLPVPPDYIHVVDCLYDQGIHAEVNFISSVKYDRYCDREAAKASMMRMLGKATQEEEQALDDFMEQHLVRSDDGWMKDYERRTDWAFISWDK